MNGLVEKREYLQRFYAKYSNYIDKILRFGIAILTLTFINNNIGFIAAVKSPIVVIAVSLVCAFIPVNVTVVLAVFLVLAQLYTMAPGIAAVTLLMFLIMFIFYFRFMPKQMMLLLIMPIAYMLKIPMIIPIACGLLSTPACIASISFGVMFYYVVSCVESYTAVLETATDLGAMGQVTTYVKQFFGNTEMWFMILSFAACLIIVYSIRRTSMDNAWMIAVISGSIVNMIVLLFIGIDANLNFSPVFVIVGTVVSAILSMLIEFFAFPVDYSRTENLQFEDDEYYYYVKAVPKLTVAAPKKTVKRIHERQETQSMDVEKGHGKREEYSIEQQFLDDIDLQKLLEEELKR